MILSPVLPPHDSGQAVMIARTFAGFDPDSYVLATIRHPAYRNVHPELNVPHLPGRIFTIPQSHRLRRYSRHHVSWAREFLQLPVRFVQAGLRVAELIKAARCEAVLAFSGADGLDCVPAGLIGSRLAGVPCFIVLYDWWRYQIEYHLGRWRPFAAQIERLALTLADRAIVTNDVQADDYFRLYGVDCTVAYNGAEEAVFAETAPLPWPRAEGQVQMVYTGQIYEAHFDALRNAIAAVAQLQAEGVSIELYSAQTERDVERGGIGAPAIFRAHLPPPAIYEVQRQADIVLLPLAFESPYPELIRTAATTKLAELLACGRPLLVHAPPGSFVAWYVSTYDCGVVVDRNDPQAVVAAIRRIKDDEALRRRVTANAQVRARTDFSIAQTQSRIASVVGSAGRA